MKLNKLIINNFKGISNMELSMEGKSTILFGINGVGKSSILRAVDLIYANIISRLLNSKRLAHMECDDISYGKAAAKIGAEFIFEDGNCISYLRSINRKNEKKHNNRELKELTEMFREHYLTRGYEDENGNWIEEPDTKNMPVFVNYGVNRLVIDVPLRVSKKNEFTKLSAFDKAIESRIDFRRLFEWFRMQEDLENQEKVRTDTLYEDRSLAAVKRAMLAMLEGFEDIHIERKPLAMKVKKNGQSLKINQLSDGEKCTIALFGDLARRMALANPCMENPLEGEGVVLIDELDLHMHTSWQRKIIRVLQQTFPNVQFMITTHSPQILGELGDDFNVFYLEKDDDVEIRPIKSLLGWDSNVILEEMMHTSSVNEQVKEQLEKMYAYIQEGAFEQAEEIADNLEEMTNGRADGIAKARVMIARGRRNEKNR